MDLGRLLGGLASFFGAKKKRPEPQPRVAAQVGRELGYGPGTTQRVPITRSPTPQVPSINIAQLAKIAPYMNPVTAIPTAVNNFVMPKIKTPISAGIKNKPEAKLSVGEIVNQVPNAAWQAVGQPAMRAGANLHHDYKVMTGQKPEAFDPTQSALTRFLYGDRRINGILDYGEQTMKDIGLKGTNPGAAGIVGLGMTALDLPVFGGGKGQAAKATAKAALKALAKAHTDDAVRSALFQVFGEVAAKRASPELITKLVQATDEKTVAPLLNTFIKNTPGISVTEKVVGKTKPVGEAPAPKTLDEAFSDPANAGLFDKAPTPEPAPRMDHPDMVAWERFNLDKLKHVSKGGSDRAVYDLGDGTVLKVAKKPRGLVQNDPAGDRLLQESGLLPRVKEIGKDYVVMEKVNPPDANTKKMVEELRRANDSYYPDVDEKEAHRLILNKYGVDGDMVANFEYGRGDLAALRNWGTTAEGKPVHVDEGTFSSHTFDFDANRRAGLDHVRDGVAGEPSGPAQAYLGVMEDWKATLAARKAGKPITRAADEAYKEVVANGGVTINLRGVKPGEGIAYSPYKDAELILTKAEATPEAIRAYMIKHGDLLNKPGHHLGGWVDDDGKVYLDISVVGPKDAKTLQAAIDNEQLAAFDLGTFEEIALGKIGKKGYSKTYEATNHPHLNPRQDAGAGTPGAHGQSEQVPAGVAAGLDSEAGHAGLNEDLLADGQKKLAALNRAISENEKIVPPKQPAPVAHDVPAPAPDPAAARLAQEAADQNAAMAEGKAALDQVKAATDPTKRAEQLVGSQPGPVPGDQTRKFAQRMSDDGDLPPQLRDGLNMGYDRKPNDVTMAQAAADLDRKGVAQVTQDLHTLKPGTANEVQQAQGMMLIRHYLDAGDVENATAVANRVAKNGTEAGRTVQILAAWKKTTPEGAYKELVKMVGEANAKLPTNKQLVITPEKANKIRELAGKVQTLTPNSREHQVAVGLLTKEMAETIPPGMLRKLDTFQTMMQLLNGKTFIRNIIGNTVLATLETAKGVTAVGIESALHALGMVKTRTLSMPNIGLKFRAGAKGFGEGVQDVNLGIRTAGASGSVELRPPVFKNVVLKGMEKLLGYELSVFDKAAYTSTFDEAVANQLKAMKLKKPTAEILDQANTEALYATFQNNSKIAKALSGSKQWLNAGKDWGIGSLVIKYPKVPGNIVSVGLDYSPVGMVKSLAQFYGAHGHMSPALQREAINNLSRGLLGTGMIAGGYYLAKNKIITARREDDPDVAAAQRQQGEGPFSFNMDALGRMLRGESTEVQEGDLIANYDWLQPNSMQLSMGANLLLGSQDADKGINNMLASFDAAAATVTGQPVFSNFLRFGTKVGRGDVSGAIGDAVGGAPASFTSSLINQVGQAMDNTSRNTYDPTWTGTAVNKVLNRVPVLRDELNPRVGTDGKDIEQYDSAAGGNNWFNTFLNPAFTKRYKADPTFQEVERLRESTGESGQFPQLVNPKQTVAGVKLALTSDQVTAMQRDMGATTMTQFKRVMGSPEYAEADDPGKVKLLTNALGDIKEASKYRTAGGDAEKLSGDAKRLLNGGNLPLEKDKDTNLGKYEAALEAWKSDSKKWSAVEKTAKERELDGLKVKSTYSKDVTTLYDMSKARIKEFLDENPEQRGLWDQLKKLDKDMKNAGLITKLKFKTGLAVAGKKGKKLATPKPRIRTGVSVAKAPGSTKAKRVKFAFAKPKAATKGSKIKLRLA